jgi:uncharacterized membrane protein
MAMGMLETTIEVDAPIESCFDMWLCEDCLTLFLKNVKGVYVNRDNNYIWNWEIEAGDQVIEWDTVVDAADENRLISWHSMDHMPADTSGVVQFEAIHPDRTRVHVEMMFNPPINAGQFVDDLFGKQIEQDILRDLQAFKALVEQSEQGVRHELVKSDAQAASGEMVSGNEERNLTPLSIRVHGRTHEIRQDPAL